MNLEAFHTTISNLVEQQDLPGVQYRVKQDGETLASANLGYADLERGQKIGDQALFRLASSSKLFVSVAFLRLVQRGQVELSTPVADILPEYGHLRVFNENGSTRDAQNPMQMIDLLRHSCGYGYGDATRLGGAYRQALMDAKLLGSDDLGYDHWRTDTSLRDWASALAKVPMEDEPGTRVCYGLGHDLAGAVIEEITAQPLDQYFTEQVCKPLGLNNTFFVVPEDRAGDLTAFYARLNDETRLVEPASASEFLRRPSSFSAGGGWDMLGNGGLVSNATDFCALLEYILQDPLTAPLLTSQSAELTFGDMLAGCEYSLGAAVVTDPERYRNEGAGSDGPQGKLWWGGSTNTYFFYVPESNRLGVMLANTFPFGHKGAIFDFGKLSLSD